MSLNTELGYKVGPRLRELVLAARGNQEAVFAQPRAHLIAHLRIEQDVLAQYPNRAFLQPYPCMKFLFLIAFYEINQGADILRPGN